VTNARSARRECLWMALAISSLPVPVSPEIRTVASVGAYFDRCDSTVLSAADTRTISSNMKA
jgi:hypothetical protein